MDIYDEIELFDCPFCGGPGVLEEEHGWSWYVVCADCGAHTGFSEYKNEEDRLDAARKAAYTWNLGKVRNPKPSD